MATITTETLTVDKVTKGTIRFAEPDDVKLPILPTLYVPKHIVHELGGAEKIRVTIEAVD